MIGKERLFRERNMKNEKELPWEEIYHFWQLAISRYLLYSCDELSAMSIVDLAAANASLVMTHYTPVEYEMAK